MNTHRAKKVQSLPLELLLIVPFVLQIFAAVGLVGYLSFLNGQKAVNEMANQLIDKASHQVNDHLENYLALPHQLNQLNAAAIAANQLDINDPIASEQYFWRQIQVFKNIGYTGFTLPNARESGAGRSSDGKSLTVYEKRPGKGKGSDYIVDRQGKRIKLLQSYDFDPLSLPGYTSSVQAGKPIWSRIYTLAINHSQTDDASKAQDPNTKDADTKDANTKDANLTIDNQYYVTATAACPVYDQTGKLRAVISTDLMLSSFSQFLHHLRISPSGQVFIFDRDGLLVGSSSHYPILHPVKDSAERLNVLESPDPLIRSISQLLNQQLGDFRSIQRERDLVISLKGQRQFIQIAPWQDSHGLDWLVVVVVPESDFMTQINANTRITIWLCFGALGVAVFLGVLTARWIAYPILQLNQASEAIAAGDLGQTINMGSIQELNRLATSFNHMAKQVKETFTALEKNNEELEDRVEERTQELKHTLEELRATQGQMVQSEKMSALGQMVAGVAHEINNPVNFIHGNLTHVDTYVQDLFRLVQSYQKHYPDPPLTLQADLEEIDLLFLKEDLAKILRSMNVGTGRIRQIVLSLRNFSRLDEADLKPVDIHEGLDNTLVILGHRLKAKPNRAAIEVIKYYGDLPEVECYAGQLNQVFMNILANAIDALEEIWIRDDSGKETTQKGLDKSSLQEHEVSGMTNQSLNQTIEPMTNDKPTLTIHTKVFRGDWIQIAIADNGVGMPESVQQRLFDPFFTTKPVGKGTGMGLSISYQIITEKHHGKLFCLSSVGKGTEFVIEIPIQQSQRNNGSSLMANLQSEK